MRLRRSLMPLLALVSAGCCSVASAEQVLLNDGSSIQGKVLSMEHGLYTIQTQSMGLIRLKQSEISSIIHGNGGVSPSIDSQLDAHRAEAGQSAVQSLQSTMASNPGIMASIMALQNDPDMQAVLRDPEVMRAVQNFDLETLSNHPKIRKLMENPSVRDIQGNN